MRRAWLDAGARVKEHDDTRALHELRPLATLGDTRAQVIIGEMYAFGEDPAAATECAMGESYAKGYEVPVDTAESVKWLRLAARGGSKKAASMLRDMRIPR